MFLTDVSQGSVIRPLPRGPHRLAREEVVASQRGRMLEAIAEAVAAKSYAATTVADVIGRAGVSRRTFYEHFADKEQCFLAAYDAGVEVLVATMTSAGEGIADPVRLTRARVRAYLQTLAAEPAFARTFLIEIGAAGPLALRRRDAVHDVFAAAAADVAPRTSAAMRLAAVGAADTLVTRWVRDGRTSELGALEDEIVRLHLALLGR